MPYASFLRDYLVYAAQHGLAPSGPHFYVGLRAFLAVTQPLCIAANETTGDAPCAGTPAEAQRLVVPATYNADLSWRGGVQGGVIAAARLQGKIAAPESIRGRVDAMLTLTLTLTQTLTLTLTLILTLTQTLTQTLTLALTLTLTRST